MLRISSPPTASVIIEADRFADAAILSQYFQGVGHITIERSDSCDASALKTLKHMTSNGYQFVQGANASPVEALYLAGSAVCRTFPSEQQLTQLLFSQEYTQMALQHLQPQACPIIGPELLLHPAQVNLLSALATKDLPSKTAIVNVHRSWNSYDYQLKLVGPSSVTFSDILFVLSIEDGPVTCSFFPLVRNTGITDPNTAFKLELGNWSCVADGTSSNTAAPTLPPTPSEFEYNEGEAVSMFQDGFSGISNTVLSVPEPVVPEYGQANSNDSISISRQGIGQPVPNSNYSHSAIDPSLQNWSQNQTQDGHTVSHGLLMNATQPLADYSTNNAGTLMAGTSIPTDNSHTLNVGVQQPYPLATATPNQTLNTTGNGSGAKTRRAYTRATNMPRGKELLKEANRGEFYDPNRKCRLQDLATKYRTTPATIRKAISTAMSSVYSQVEANKHKARAGARSGRKGHTRNEKGEIVKKPGAGPAEGATTEPQQSSHQNPEPTTQPDPDTDTAQDLGVEYQQAFLDLFDEELRDSRDQGEPS